MKVINLMESVVEMVLEKQIDFLQMNCTCDQCKNDVLALALNALPTRYVSTMRGHTIQRAKLMDEQTLADVLREISKAAVIVSAKPSHD
jgi:competence protein ComFB